MLIYSKLHSKSCDYLYETISVASGPFSAHVCAESFSFPMQWDSQPIALRVLSNLLKYLKLKLFDRTYNEYLLCKSVSCSCTYYALFALQTFSLASLQHAYECCHYSNLHSCVRSINCRKKIFQVDLKTFGWDKKDVYSSCDRCYNCAAVGCHTLHLDTRPRLVDCALIMLSLLQSKNEGGISFYSFLDERLPGPATLHKLNQVQHI